MNRKLLGYSLMLTLFAEKKFRAEDQYPPKGAMGKAAKKQSQDKGVKFSYHDQDLLYGL
jgi:hypothetical protein